jgi:adenylate cyclase
MSRNLDYTTFARRFANRYPLGNYLLAQINFWIISYILLAVLTHLVLMTAGSALHADINLTATLVIALYLGFFTGIISGLANRFFEKRLFHNKALGIVIISKVIIYLVVFVILISFVRYSIYPFLLTRFYEGARIVTEQQPWDSFFYLLLIYTIVIGLLSGFINQVNKKFGPGVLLPLLLGKYRKPREEERIFLFMDLTSSTSIAEALGHLKYSAFIRDSFMDINAVLAVYNAQVYQYVGDAIVLTWTIDEGLRGLNCIEFFFACKSRFNKRSAYYQEQYGQTPRFKAGMHMGKVTAVEVGEIKRDIAYHGDTLNTAARIQSVCNEYDHDFLVSMALLEYTPIANRYTAKSLGMISLKGKVQAVEIAVVSAIL